MVTPFVSRMEKGLGVLLTRIPVYTSIAKLNLEQLDDPNGLSAYNLRILAE